MKIIGLIIAVSGFLSASLMAGPANEAWEAYLAGNFKLVEGIFNESIADTGLTKEEQARLYLALGCSDAMRDRNAIAATSFETALNLDQKLNLTASDLPPPVWRVFHPIQDRIRKQTADEIEKNQQKQKD